MGISLQLYRAVCGTFAAVFACFMSKRAEFKSAMAVSILTLKSGRDGVLLGLTLTYLFWGGLLLRCGDVETNPGPGQGRKLRQTSLTSGAGGRSTITGKAAGKTKVSADMAASTPTTVHSRQESSPTVAPEETFTTMRAKMEKVENLLKTTTETMRSQIQMLTNSVDALKEEMCDIRQDMNNLRTENLELKQSNTVLMDRVKKLEKNADVQEGRSRRNNIIIHGMEKKSNETGTDCEMFVKNLLSEKMDVADVKFDSVHRINSKPNSPIIARCCFYQDKLRILKAKTRLKGSRIFVDDDFSKTVRDIRHNLAPYLKSARAEGKNVRMVFDHLIINGERMTLNDLKRRE